MSTVAASPDRAGSAARPNSSAESTDDGADVVDAVGA